MAFWSGKKLTDEIPKKGIVDLFSPDQVDCSAYTLTLGSECFVTPDYEVNQRDNVKKQLTAPEIQEIDGKSRKVGGGTLVIPPGQFAYLLTEEIIHIPVNVMGFISLKSGVKWRGLINVSGFHVDPGFKGRLVYSVYNAGPSSIHLNRGQNLFLLWLADLDRKSNADFAKSGDDPQLEIPSSRISDVDRRIHSLQQLSEKIEKNSQQIANFKWVAGIAFGLLTLVVGILRFVPGQPTPEPADAIEKQDKLSRVKVGNFVSESTKSQAAANANQDKKLAPAAAEQTRTAN